jgi:hypothetical protein
MLAAFAIVATVPLLAAYVPANDMIEASEFVVRDKSGAVRARLFIDEQGKSRLILRDSDGRSTANLASGDGASLTLGDKSDEANVVISAASGAKGVVVLEGDGKPKAVLSKPKESDVSDPLEARQ